MYWNTLESLIFLKAGGKILNPSEYLLIKAFSTVCKAKSSASADVPVSLQSHFIPGRSASSHWIDPLYLKRCEMFSAASSQLSLERARTRSRRWRASNFPRNSAANGCLVSATCSLTFCGSEDRIDWKIFQIRLLNGFGQM